MKKFLIFLFFATLFTGSAFAQRQTITKFEGQTITGVAINGAFDVRISQGESSYAKVDIADELVSKLTFEISDDGVVRLGFGTKMGSLFKGSKNRPMATIVLSKLDYIYVSGASTVIGKGQFTAANFTMTLSGAAFASFINVNCENANLSIDGEGKTEDITINASKKLTAEVGGAAKVTFGGSAAVSKVTSSGPASVDMLGFDCPNQTAITLGTSLIKANVSGTAEVTVGGISSFKYTGSGVVKGEKAEKL